MKNIEEKGLIDRMAEPTPKRSKRIGRVATVIAAACGAVLTLGGVTAPAGLAILTALSVASTGVAVYHGQQVDETVTKVNALAGLFKSLRKK